MKIQIVDNGPRQEHPFIVLSSENYDERHQLEQLLSYYKDATLFEGSPGFKVSIELTRKP
jgi:hypothetical protein